MTAGVDRAEVVRRLSDAFVENDRALADTIAEHAFDAIAPLLAAEAVEAAEAEMIETLYKVKALHHREPEVIDRWPDDEGYAGTDNESEMLDGCADCNASTGDGDSGFYLWPCPTVRVIEAALAAHEARKKAKP